MDFQEQADRILRRLDQFSDRELRAQALGSRLDLFCAGCVKIRPKAGGSLIPFPLNPIQFDFIRSLRRNYQVEKGIDIFRGIRVAIVKPRQLGFSTFAAAMFFLDGLRSPGRVSVILSHDEKISKILLETYRTIWEHLPSDLKSGLALSSDSKYEFQIVFPGDQAENPPSKFIIQTEAGHPWRGGVIHNLHASECAFYRDYMGFKASFVQAVGMDGNILLETTANGQNDYFKEVMNSQAGRSPYRVVFYSWFDHPEYRLPWIAQKEGGLSAEEVGLMAAHGLSLEQIAWRRAKQADLGALFQQEYPESLEGAFLSTGRPFFDAVGIAAAREAVASLPAPEMPRNGWRIWERPIQGETYLLAADIAEGIDHGSTDVMDLERGGSDFSCAYVLKVRNLQVVAGIHGRIPPVEFARHLDTMGRMYGACVAPERNNHGHTVVATLQMAYYPWLYQHLEYDQAGQRSLRPGFPTDVKTRPMLLDSLDAAIRSGALLCPDVQFWAEASTFHRNPNTGKPEALPACHDDRVMALGIGAYLCTLGRTAWGAPENGSDGAGFPVTPTSGTNPAPRHAPPPPGQRDPTIPPPPQAEAMAQERELLRKFTCGGCVHFVGGRCRNYSFIVGENDPGCGVYYTRPTPLDTVPEWGEGLESSR